MKYDFINGSSILIIVWMTIAVIIRVTNWKFNKTAPAISLFLAFPASIVILLVYIFFFDK
ncbi:hypothetical protein DMH20_27035 [Escherichia coli]|nr:hypothetical protein [Escherichia coli]